MDTATGIDWSQWLGSERALDPYLIWADCTGFAAAGPMSPGAPLPFLVEATGGTLTASGLAGPLRRVEVAPAYTAAAQPADGSSFFTARVRPGDVAALLAAASIPRFQLSLARSAGLPPDGRGRQVRPAQALPAALAGPEGRARRAHTVIGIIDDGCPHASANLADRQGRTRVRHLWDQGADALAAQAAGSPWTPAAEFGNGMQIDGAALDRYRRATAAAGVYAALGIDRITGRPWTHGNAVCHLAAGSRVPVDLDDRPAARDASSELPIVFVQLPLATVADTTGGSIGYHVLDALHYIHARALDLAADAGPAPQVVVNLSYGSMAGPHDGTSLAERALVDFLRSHDRLSLVVAAGNAPRVPMHLQFDLKVGARQTIDWMIAPDHPLENYLEIWWPEGVDLGGVEVRLRAPGETGVTLTARHGAMQCDGGDAPRSALVFCKRVAQGRRGTMTLAAVRATRGPDAAWPGHWRVDVVNRGREPIAAVHVWVERNDILLGPRRPQQARLMNVPVRRCEGRRMLLASLSNIDPMAALGVPYTTRYLVVGASRLFDGRRSCDSSTGPSRESPRQGPDGLAPADLGPARPGLRVDGPFDGRWLRAAGSSAATAVVTRKLAGDFEQRTRPSPAPSPGPLQVRFPQAAGEDGWFRVGPAGINPVASPQPHRRR